MKLYELNASDPHGNIASLRGKTVIRFHANSRADAVRILLCNFEFSTSDFLLEEIREISKDSTTL